MLLDATGKCVTSQKREIVTTNPDIARFASMADTPFRVLELTVVCMHCGGTPQMRNSPGDTTWKMECSCSVRILKNPKVQ